MTIEDRIPKPAELLGAADAAFSAFALLKGWFSVPDDFTIDLSSVDVVGLDEPLAVTAMAMRKLQALRYAASPGVKTASDVVVVLITELERAIRETPARLRLLNRDNPPRAEQELLRSCLDAVSSAGDAIARLCSAHHGGVLELD